MARLCVLIIAFLFLCGCNRDESKTAHTTSAQFATLEEKTEFLRRYVSLTQHCETLDFSIDYHDNSGGLVPGPSDWDIRVVATVPEAELQEWIPTDTAPLEQEPDRSWLASVPTEFDLSGMEWYGSNLGIDRQKRLVAFRSTGR